MTTATIKKVRTPDQLAALAALDMAVDGAKATTTAGVRQSFEGLRLVLTGADAEAFGPGSRGLVEAHYRSAWSKTISSAISTVVVAGVVDTGLAVTGGFGAQYGAERGGEWPGLMAKGQIAAWSEVSSVAREAELPEEDTRELLFLATGLSKQDAGYLARQQVTIVKSTEESLPPVAKRIRASVQRRSFDLLQRRGVKTAEYELTKGYNDGKRLAHVQALKVGLADEVRATFVTARDEDVCPICSPLHNKSRVARSASTLYNRWSDKALSLPVHFNCRCVLVYETVKYAMKLHRRLAMAG